MTDIVKRLRACSIDFMWADHAEVPKNLCAAAADEIHRLRVELQHARDGLTKGRSRMREDLERHKPLVQAVEGVVEEGYMHVEDLARLRAALDGLRPNVGIEPVTQATQER